MVAGQGKPAAIEKIKLQPYWKIWFGNILHIVIAGYVFLACRASILIAFIAALFVIGALLLMVAETIKGERRQWRHRWARFAIYAVAVSVGWGLASHARENEKRDFDNIIAAVEQYKAAENRYPDKLDQLTPRYLAFVPTGNFRYHADSNHMDAHLSHRSSLLPESYIYDFESRKRVHSD